MIQAETNLLGPFIGHVTDSKATIWLQLCDLGPGGARSVPVTLHEQIVDAPVSQTGTINVSDYDLGVGLVTFEGLKADTTYYHRLWQDSEQKARLDLQGLEDSDLHFRTLPLHISSGQLDFLLMSCHNPETSKDDGADGFAVWAQMREIMEQN